MSKVRIKVSKLKGEDRKYMCTPKQIDYIKFLMLSNNLSQQFYKYFTFQGKSICNHITLKEASRLIKTLKEGKEVYFVNKLPNLGLKEGKLINDYSPKVDNSNKDVDKITYEEYQLKLNNNLNSND